jgi:hypothetical protein
MRRSGLLLGIGAPAAFLTFMAQPIVRASADSWTPVVAVTPAPIALPGMRPASLALSPTRVAGLARAATRTGPVADEAQDMGLKAVKPARRTVREGCEIALSALVGPEARRMVPGRCIS